MARDDQNRQPRWDSGGFRPDEQQSDDRQGDRSMSRNYSRDDQRRYARRSEEQGERLRSLRGQRGDRGQRNDPGHRTWDADLNTDQIGIHDARALDFQQDRGRDWGYERDYNPARQQRRANQPRGQSPRMSQEDREIERERWRMNQSGPGSTDRWQGNRPGSDRYDNYWGMRQQGRDYRIRYRGDWWNNSGGRGDVASARRPGEYDLPRQPSFDWIEDEDYSYDPGFDYEFGTDFDFLNDVNLENYGNQSNRWRPGGERGNQSREQRSGNRRDQNQGSWAEMDYGWEGAPYHQRARYREVWNVPGPYAGVGPQGYQRSDERIKEEICEIFTDNGQIDSSGLSVEVNNGEVTLSGDVDRRREKYLAEDIAASVWGVNDVNNRIRVNIDDGARVRGVGFENVVMPGRIQPGMRVAGVDGKNVGQVREIREDGFILSRPDNRDTYIPFRAIKRTNGQIILHVHANEIDQQRWKEV